MIRGARRLRGPLGLIGLLALLPAVAFAWGATGHRVIARIAENHLTPAARAAAFELAGPAGLAPISTWADEIRSDPRYTGGVAGRPDTRPWHYINLDTIEQLPATSPPSRFEHIVDAIRHFETVLAHRAAPAEIRAEALRWLVHLYGDLHQPLHVGLALDRGGNMVDLDWFGERSNLHRVWDSGIIDHTRLSFTELAQFIDHPPPKTVARIQKGDLRAWVAEGIALRPAVYALSDRTGPVSGVPKRPSLAYAYFDRQRPVVEERLLAAGLRLAARLNALLGEE